MVIVSGLLSDFSVSVHPSQAKLPFTSQRCNETRFKEYNTLRLISKGRARTRIKCSFGERFRTRYATSIGNGHREPSFDDDGPEESFWLTLIKEALWGLKSLSVFLIEQPSQLKYIEWPSFQSTLKTATLTLVLVAMLIVALSSIDSALCYMLALRLRRTP